MTQTARAEQARVSRRTVARYDALAGVSVGAWRGKRSNGGRRRALSLHHMQMLLAWHLAYPDAYLDEARDIFVVTVGIRFSSVQSRATGAPSQTSTMPCHAMPSQKPAPPGGQATIFLDAVRSEVVGEGARPTLCWSGE
jgi:hypothetical protein